jgi:heme exporter protein B
MLAPLPAEPAEPLSQPSPQLAPWAIILVIAQKDWRIEGRARDVLLSTVFFAGLVLMIFAFALTNPDNREQVWSVTPGILWVAMAFSGILAAGRAFGAEQDDGALEALLLYPVAHEYIYLGKLLGNLGFMAVLSGLITPFALLLYGPPINNWPLFIATIVLGVLGFSIVSTFHAALTVNLRAREALLPVLIFPLVVPVVLATVKATSALIGGISADRPEGWLQLLLAFDVIYLVACTLAFPAIVET